MIDFAKLAGEKISSIAAYKPGKPIGELKREFGLTNIIKLASNENPMGVSKAVKDAILQALPDISRYPLGDAYDLRMAVAAEYNVAPDKLLFGSGSNEIIELLLRTFLKDGEHVISPAPSFSVYGLISQAMGSSCTWIETKEPFNFDLNIIAEKINDKTRVVFLANPNNPTGTYYNEIELNDFMGKVRDDVIVVMDEAYIEFADTPDIPNTLWLQSKFPNMVLMRTFSKAYGLAGLRMGFCIADAACCAMMNRVRQPFNTNMLAQVAAVAALKDKAWLKSVLQNNRECKDYLYKEFISLGLEYIPTQANFMLVKVGNGEKVFNDLLRKGVIVRFMGGQLAEYIRISIGTKEECEIFIKALKEVLQ